MNSYNTSCVSLGYFCLVKFLMNAFITVYRSLFCFNYTNYTNYFSSEHPFVKKIRHQPVDCMKRLELCSTQKTRYSDFSLVTNIFVFLFYQHTSYTIYFFFQRMFPVPISYFNNFNMTATQFFSLIRCIVKLLSLFYRKG